MTGTDDSSTSLNSLFPAIRAMGECARRACRPAWFLVAGLAYQFVVLGGTFGSIVFLPIVDEALPGMGRAFLDKIGLVVQPLPQLASLIDKVADVGAMASIALVPMALVLFRLAAGIARISSDRHWESSRGPRRLPRLRAAWRAGRGFAVPGLGMWLLFPMMMFIATVLFVGPIQLFVGSTDLGGMRFLGSITAGGLVVLLLGYSFMLSILFQLAVQSLVHNRRGVGSAIQHAWRLVKGGPTRVLRAAAADFLLYTAVFAVHGLVFLLERTLSQEVLDSLGSFLSIPLLIGAGLLYGIMGCARSGFWAKAYTSLGGISTVE